VKLRSESFFVLNYDHLIIMTCGDQTGENTKDPLYWRQLRLSAKCHNARD